MAVDLPGISLAGVVIDFVSAAAGTTILLTGLAAGIFRMLAVLGKSTPEKSEWFTALGFAWGMGVAAFLFALDAVLS